jgi:stearoyl-CoA desaturase (delta-9 desaturase)
MTLANRTKWFYNKYKYQIITLTAHVMFLTMVLTVPGYLAVGLIAGWLTSNLFHYLFMHRIYTHNHFEISRPLRLLGLAVFTMMNLGSPPVYAAVHMRHHAKSGTEQDPHNPYSLGWWRTLFSLWDENFAPDRRVLTRMLQDPDSKWFHERHITIAWISAIVLPFLIVTSFWMSKIVVILVHVKWLGYADHDGNDTSRNVWWLKPLTWGEELHHNHHYYANRPDHNIKQNWREFDLLYYIGKLIGKNK